MFKRKCTVPEIVIIVILLLLALLSATFFSTKLSSPAFHAKTIQVLDEQKQEALTLSVAVTAASTALSFMPDDTASPIANELANLSLPLFLIVAIIYLETFLLSTFGWIATVFLIPAACLFTIGFILSRKHFLLSWIKKASVLSLTLLFLIPASAMITAQVEDTFSETINQKLHAASHITSAAESEDTEEKNAFFSFFSSLATNVTAMADAARNMLSTLVEAVAVLLITSFVIPVLTLLVFLQIMKLALNVSIPVEKLALLLPTAQDKADAHAIAQKEPGN